MTTKTREQLLAEWRKVYGEPPAWLNGLTNEGIEWHLAQAKIPMVEESGEV